MRKGQQAHLPLQTKSAPCRRCRRALSTIKLRLGPHWLCIVEVSLKSCFPSLVLDLMAQLRQIGRAMQWFLWDPLSECGEAASDAAR
jgi:hypothetical protein